MPFDPNSVDLTADIGSGELDNAPASAPAGQVPAQGADAVPANTAPAKVEADKPSSLRDQLTSAFRGKTGEPQAQEGAQTAQDGRARNPDGTFAPTPAEAATAASLAASGQPIQAPANLSPQEAQQFAALPVEMQQYVARTMAGIEETSARYAGYDQIEQVIASRRQAWAMNGMSEGQAVNQLFAISDFASNSPKDFVRWFAGSQGIDLEALVYEGGGEDEFVDPVVAQLQQQVQQLSGQLTGFTQSQQQQAHNATVNEISAFATEAGTDGKPLRPHFEELGAAVLPFIQAVKAEKPGLSNREVLGEAYDRACWGTPSVRAKMVAAQEAQRLEAARATAARARNAGSSVTGEAPQPGSTVVRDAGNGSIRDTLKQQFAEHSGRV
jgi:hypothetical protein